MTEAALAERFRLDGRLALVTGAGRGIGQGLAEWLADQGATVAVNDLSATRAGRVTDAIVARGGRAVASVFDVTDRGAVADAVAALGASTGQVDILVNNAGIPAEGMTRVPFRAMDPAEWRRFVDLNLYGPMNCTHAVLDGMCERSWGRVVTISSEAGRVGLDTGVALYGAAKAGAVGLLRHVAVEVAPFGVTINAVSLGLMDNVATSEWAQKVAPTIPCGRLGSPADVAAAVVFLVSEEASWVTGQVLPVNGGVRT